MTAEVHPFPSERSNRPTREELVNLVMELRGQVRAIVGKPGVAYRRDLVARTEDALRREGRIS